MKRLISAFGILIIILIFSAFSLFHIINAGSQTISYISEIEDKLANQEYQKVNETIEDLQKYWKKEELVLSLACRNNEVDEISAAIAQLSGFSNDNEYGDIHALLNMIRFKVQHLIESEFPSLFNIL